MSKIIAIFIVFYLPESISRKIYRSGTNLKSFVRSTANFINFRRFVALSSARSKVYFYNSHRSGTNIICTVRSAINSYNLMNSVNFYNSGK